MMKENDNKVELEESRTGEEPVIIDDGSGMSAESDNQEKFGNRTVYIAGEDFDENRPFLKEGYDGKKAKKLEKKKSKKAVAGTKKQKNYLFILGTAIVLLIIGLCIVLNYVNTIIYVDEADNTKYYIKKKDNPEYDKDAEGSLKKIYMLCDKEGYTLDITPDGYYSTNAGTLVKVDPETGEYTVIAVVDVEGNEQIGTQRRIMVFPHTPKADIESIEVHNSYGSYVFKRDEQGDFVIKGYEAVAYDKELFASLVVSTGYTLTIRKIDGPIVDENGEFTEYGLAPEVRKDKEGKDYNYEPAWYILTDKKGTKHKVIVGDMLVTQGGYYIQYVNMEKNSDGSYTETPRKAVYVVSTTLETTVLQPLKSLVTPMVVYPMSMNDYFDVSNFYLFRYDYTKYHETKNEDDISEKMMIGFSYVDLDDRMNTEAQSQPYQPTKDFMSGYMLNDMSIDSMLQSLYTIKYLRVMEVGPVEGTLKRYGLDEAKYSFTYIFNAVDDETGEKTKIPNVVLVSDKTADGTYYMYSILFDLIVEVDSSSLMFLEYEAIDWIDSDILSLNIASCEEINIQSPLYNVIFDFDNSKSDLSDGFSSNALELTIKRPGMADMLYRNSFTITDKKGFTWTVDVENIKATDSNGTEVSIKNLYRATNKYGKTVKVVDGWITDAAGNSISVTADTVTVRDAGGNETVFGRASMYNFRQFYKLILYGSISGEITYEATPEELDAMRKLDDSECQLKMTVKTREGRELVYRFYKLSERKSFMTINGEGNFFVLRTLVDKIISDAQKAVSGEFIDAQGKY